MAAPAQLNQELNPSCDISGILEDAIHGLGIAGDGLHQVAIDAVFFEQTHHPLPQEFGQLRRQQRWIYLEMGQQATPVGGCPAQQGPQVEGPAIRFQNLDNAIAGAAQGVGI